jgi:hypothetical protein
VKKRRAFLSACLPLFPLLAICLLISTPPSSAEDLAPQCRKADKEISKLLSELRSLGTLWRTRGVTGMRNRATQLCLQGDFPAASKEYEKIKVRLRKDIAKTKGEQGEKSDKF